MNDMDFRTDQPHCEIFLASETHGFLMLSAGGKLYRKWQGLNIGDLSVFADLHWSLKQIENGKNEQSAYPFSWCETSHNADSIERVFRLNCGCHINETWRWTRGSDHLSIHWTWAVAETCQTQHHNFNLRVTPRWTLCPAGQPTAGGGLAQIIHEPHKPEALTVRSELADCDIEFTGLRTETQASTPWSVDPSIHHEDIPTPHDQIRGENHHRTVLLTHFSELRFQPNETATLSIKFARKATSKFSKQESSKSERTSCSELSLCPKDWQTGFKNSQSSLTQLIRRRSDGTLGLQAGLPWFTQFWTRDLCHSFRAAFLWSGRTADGEKIMCDLWNASGKAIPNYTTSSATTTNSADALPLLLLSTADLIDVIGISENLLLSLHPIKEHLRHGAEQFKKGDLFRHGPADTWMDAQKQTPQGQMIACSPRADRAIEIQCFWLAAISRWSEILRAQGEPDFSETLNFAVETGVRTIRSCFYNAEKKRWADHLHKDGTQDFSLRPNILLAFSALQRAGILFHMLEEVELEHLMNELIQADLIVPYGIRTLSPDTPVRHPEPINELFFDQSDFIYENKIHFHPYHEFGSRRGLEHPDWAYHNGTIWPWLSAPAVQLLLKNRQTQHHAFQLTQTLVWHAVHGTQGGALTELLDGLSSHSQWSWPKGAPHQAWSEAALVHIICEEWLGLRLTRGSREIHIDTRNWRTLEDFRFEFPTNDATVTLSYAQNILTMNTSSQSPITIHFQSNLQNVVTEPTQTLTHTQPVRIKLTHL